MKLLLGEKAEAAADPVSEQVRIGEAELGAALKLPVGNRGAYILALAEEVFFADRNFGEPARGGRIAAGDREFAGELVFDFDVEDHAVGRRPRLVGDLHGLEIAEVFEPAFGPVDERAIVWIALVDIEFAPDHVVARPHIAPDVDAFDIDARAFLDHVDEIDAARAEITIAARAHLREGIAALGELNREVLDRFLDQFGIVNFAGLRAHVALNGGRVYVAQVGNDVDGAGAVLLALVEGDGDHESARRLVDFDIRRDDAEVGIAVFEIEAPQELLVGADAIRVVDVRALDPAQPVAFRRRHDVAQFPIGKRLVADEHDLLDRRLVAFVDFEDEVDAAVSALDDLGFDPHIEAAAAAIDFDDPLHVGLHGGARQRPARFRLDFGAQRLVLDLLVALERDAADDRVFHHRHHQPVADQIDPHVLEKTGGVERFQRFVDFERIGALAGPDADIADDGFAIDAPVALHNDGSDHRLGDGLVGGRDGYDSSARGPAKGNGREEGDPAKNADLKFHAIRDLPSPLRPPLEARPSASAHARARILTVLETFNDFSCTCKRPAAPAGRFSGLRGRSATVDFTHTWSSGCPLPRPPQVQALACLR